MHRPGDNLGQAAMARERRRQQLVMRPGPDGRERLVLLWRLWQKYMVIVTMRRVAVAVREGSRLADGGAFLSEVRRALASERGARHSPRVSGAVVSWARYRSVLSMCQSVRISRGL